MKLLLIFATVACAAASNSCDSPMSHFTQMIGDEMINSTKTMMHDQMTSCMQINLPQRFAKMSSDCFFKVTKFSLKDFTLNIDITLPSREDYVNWYKDIVSCELETLGVSVNGNDIDSGAYLDTVLSEKWSDNESEEAIFQGILSNCVNKFMTGKDSVHQQVYRAENCIVESMIDNCQIIGEDYGLTLVILKAFYTLMEAPKCNGFALPRTLAHDYFAECLAEANVEWQAAGNGNYEGSMLNHNTRNKIETGFNFFRTWGSKIMSYTSECVTKKTGLVDLKSGVMNHDRAIEMIQGFNWQDTNARDQLIGAVNECRQDKPSSEDNSIMEMFIPTQHQQLWTPFRTYRFKFERCFGPKFVDICGLNNEISNWYYPMMNNEINDLVMKDFKEKKGFTATLHMNSVFRDQFIDFMKQIL